MLMITPLFSVRAYHFFLLIRNICSNIEYKGTFSDYLSMIARKALLVAMNALLKALNVYLVIIKALFWLGKLEARKTLFYTFLISFLAKNKEWKKFLFVRKNFLFDILFSLQP